MSAAPLTYRWDGEAFSPLPGYQLLADKRFVAGETYDLMEPPAERSAKSHDEYFALMHRAYDTLPEQVAMTFLNEEQFRKHALIRCGYASERLLVCSTAAAAERAAAFMRPFDDYAIIVPRECVVRVLTAQSQSKKAMGADVFQESKDRVLSHVCDIIGCSVQQLRDNERIVA